MLICVKTVNLKQNSTIGWTRTFWPGEAVDVLHQHDGWSEVDHDDITYDLEDSDLAECFTAGRRVPLSEAEYKMIMVIRNAGLTVKD